MNTFKKFLPDVLVVLLFAAISFTYFYPADIEGRILYRHDSSAGRGMGEESRQYKERTGEITRWTNSVFGGMPTYQTAPSYESSTTLNHVLSAYHLWLPENVWYVFAYLLGFYILLPGYPRSYSMGFQQLFLYYHSCRTYMEGVSLGISATDDCRHLVGIQGEIPCRISSDGYLHCL